ncbi:MAG: CPBP family intramembrane glutamic endopeptidase [Erythrobacter sp.]|jgi:membrane protease YdiL (CAAX protease family)|nr:CPBP family intramembrane glutamic endopeptidase [Erythrobacter sp.]
MTNAPARPLPFAALAIVLAMLANAVNADVLRALGVDHWFTGFTHGWPLLLNALDLAAVAIALWLVGGVGWARQWRACGLARPIIAPVMFAAILFVPAFAALYALAGPAKGVDPLELLFGGIVFPVFEEVIFRGLAIGVLMIHFRWPFWIAALLPSLFFGAFHMWQGDGVEEALGIAGLTAIGSVWFGWVYWKWGFNLWPAIFLHAGLNLAWPIFELGDNALGGQTGNIVRIAVIAGSVLLTLRAQGWLRRMAGESPVGANASG